ncbi:MAG TPA: efflux RND transporter periplasmic adaptor subunit [Candidatus Sulfopaludibacter sp.]|nr:efflux RND transporter periplasmic adaptor subunit [Candidatus Sulfopaludibacter sp.]
MSQINTSEDRLRAEIESLKRQLEEQKKQAAEVAPMQKGPSAGTLLVVVVLLAALGLAGYYYGYLPRQHREQVLAAESLAAIDSLPVVNVVKVTRSSAKGNLSLPGNMQAVTEAPVLARASGYIKKRYVDIGDRVTAGEVLADIEAPELVQQLKQTQAAAQQADAAVQQAEASLVQGRSNENLARITSERWQRLFDKGVVSRQDNDTYRLQWEAQQASVQALEKAVNAAKSNASAADANVSRITELLGYQTVRAPFAGVITVRNIDTGALVNEGATLLFRIAQTDRLRVYLNVPQGDAPQVRVGQQATLTLSDLHGRLFTGVVTRTADALDPATRTLLVEVQADNRGGALLPGMYAQVEIAVPRHDPPLQIPGGTLLVRSDGPQAAVVQPDGTVHYQRIQLGRDFGDHVEVLSGLEEGQSVVVNPGDTVRDGVKVKAVTSEKSS